MKPLKRIFLAATALPISLTFLLPAQGQPLVPQDYLGRWVLLIEGDSRQLLLDLGSVTPASDKAWKLDAAYGYADLAGKPAAVELTMAEREPIINIKTATGHTASLTQRSDGHFYGFFNNAKNGRKGHSALIRESALGATGKIPPQALPQFPKLSAAVPADCAQLQGVYTGKWEGLGTTWLWIRDVSETCTASYAYTETPVPPMDFRTAVLSNATLFFPSSNGSAEFAFVYRANAMQATYARQNGTKLQATMVRVGTEDGSLEREFAAQRVRESFSPPDPAAPTNCQQFSGTWDGPMALGNYGNARLGVYSIDKDCNAKYFYASGGRYSRDFKVEKIKGGNLTVLCNPDTHGYCTFWRTGDEMKMSYSNLSGGTNSAVLTKSK